MAYIFSLYAETAEEITSATKVLKMAFPKKALNYHHKSESVEYVTHDGKKHTGHRLDLVLDESGEGASIRAAQTAHRMRNFLIGSRFAPNSLTLSSPKPENKALAHFVIG